MLPWYLSRLFYFYSDWLWPYCDRSRAGRHFFGTEKEMRAVFGPVGNTEKKVLADYEQLLRAFFLCLKNIVASALKSCIK